jgi:hypothetical protein
MQHYANSIAILQCTSSANITAIIIIANRIRQNVFVHMQRHASGEKKKRVDLSSVLLMHTRQIHHIVH